MAIGVYAAYFMREQFAQVIEDEENKFGLNCDSVAVGKATILFQERVAMYSTVKPDGSMQELAGQLGHADKHYLVPTYSTLPHDDFDWEFHLKMSKVDKADPRFMHEKTVKIFWMKLFGVYTFVVADGKATKTEMDENQHPMLYGLKSCEQAKVDMAKQALSAQPVRQTFVVLI